MAATRAMVNRAEQGEWQALLEQYLEDRREEAEGQPPWEAAADDPHERHKRAARLMRETKGVGRAKQQLLGSGVLQINEKVEHEIK